jgi:hypothetical protein
MYCKGPIHSAESTAIQSVRAGTIKGDSPQQVTDYSTKSVLADLEWREKNLGTRYFAYGDFLAFHEVLGHLPGICNLIDLACQIKKGPVSPDDFKVANRVFGLGGRLSRKQVDFFLNCLIWIEMDLYRLKMRQVWWVSNTRTDWKRWQDEKESSYMRRLQIFEEMTTMKKMLLPQIRHFRNQET